MKTLESTDTIRAIALKWLTDEPFGLKYTSLNYRDREFVKRAIALLKKDDASYEEWTALKEDCSGSLFSAAANAVSRISSAMRNPAPAGISGMRDAAQSVVEAYLVTARDDVQDWVQRHFDEERGASP